MSSIQTVQIINQKKKGMNFLNEQLYQKNMLLKRYEQQNQRLKSIISRQKSLQYLKFPKDGSLSSKMNDLEMQNHNIKNKLNQTLIINTELMNKAEKERMFNKRLQAQNENLKRKIIQISQKLEAQNELNLVGNIEKGGVDFSMLGGIADGKSYHQSQPNNPNPQQDPPTISHPYPQHSPFRLFSPSIQQSDMLIRALNMQKQKQQYLQEIEYLKGELEMRKDQLQRSQAEVKTLRQRVLQLQENNRSVFVMVQNDRLKGSIAEMQLMRSTLQLGLSRAMEQKQRGQKQIQILRESSRQRMQSLSAQNDNLRKILHKQSIRKDITIQSSQLNNHRSQNNNSLSNKKRKYSQVSSIKSHKSIKQSEKSHSIKNQLESKIQILVENERGNVIQMETKQKDTSDSKQENMERYNASSIMDQAGMDYLKPSSVNNKQQQRQSLQMLKEENLSTYPQPYQQYLVTKPVIKETRVSFYLDDIEEEDNIQEERQRERCQKDNVGNSKSLGRGCQNSLMSDRTLRGEVKSAQGRGSSLWDQIKNVFAA